MNLVEHKAFIVASADDSKAYLWVRSHTSRKPGNVPCLTYAELNTDPMAISKLMVKDPVIVIVRDCPWSKLSQDFMAALVTPDRFPIDLPGSVFRMRPAPYFIFLVHSEVPLRCTHPKLIIENL